MDQALEALACLREVNNAAYAYMLDTCPAPQQPERAPSRNNDDRRRFGMGINPMTGGPTIQTGPGMGYDMSTGKPGPSWGF